MAATSTTQATVDQGIILTYKNEVETLIKQNQGVVIYTKDDVIIASDISDKFYNELIKSPYVESVSTLPLKRFVGQDLSKTNEANTTTTASVNQSGNTKTTPPVDPTKLNQGGIGTTSGSGA